METRVVDLGIVMVRCNLACALGKSRRKRLWKIVHGLPNPPKSSDVGFGRDCCPSRAEGKRRRPEAEDDKGVSGMSVGSYER